MPTLRPRHVITETGSVADALDDAARRWPEDRNNRARLLRRLIEEGHRAISTQQEQAVVDRREAIARTSGALTGMYGPDYLAAL
ncbi:MAG TPA: hypothetical protein VFA78_02280, partial [Chloroflexota bacterium]|nr:hypothetical protein [Chloroflexota bacterium]